MTVDYQTWWIEKDEREHVIDNTDTRELTEQRLRFVYDDFTDQEIEDYLDVFYGIKEGKFVEVEDADNNLRLKAELS